MYLQEILEVAIGLIFIWLIISIAVMQLLEWIASAREWRAMALRESIRQLLNDPHLVDEFYKHPIISGLSTKSGKITRLPAFIAADKFAVTLFDLAITAGTNASPINSFFSSIKLEFEKIQDPNERELAKQDWEAILNTAKQIATSRVGETAVDTISGYIKGFGDKYTSLQKMISDAMPQVQDYYKNWLDAQRQMAPVEQADELTLRQIRLGILALDSIYKESKVKGSVGTLLTGIEDYVKEGERALVLARTNIENWFNDAMDRLSGTYKRKAQWVSFLLGLIIALLLNVDSITIATSMWREPTLRQAIVAEANNFTEKDTESSNINSEEESQSPIVTVASLQKELKALNLPLGWFGEPIPSKEGISCSPSILTSFDEDGNPTHVMGIRMGNVCYPIFNSPPLTASYWVGWLVKVLGLLLTGAAAAQGAPFWFDILKKFTNVRSSGPNPNEKST